MPYIFVDNFFVLCLDVQNLIRICLHTPNYMLFAFLECNYFKAKLSKSSVLEKCFPIVHCPILHKRSTSSIVQFYQLDQNGMLRPSLGGAVIFISLQYFILPHFTYFPACKPEVQGIAIWAVSQAGQNKVLKFKVRSRVYKFCLKTYKFCLKGI